MVAAGAFVLTSDSGTVITGAVYLDGVDKIRIQTDITVLENTDLIAPPDPIISSRAEISRTIESLSDRVAARIAAALDTELLAWYAGGDPPPSLDAYRFLLQAGEQYLQLNWGPFKYLHTPRDPFTMIRLLLRPPLASRNLQ